MKVRLSLDWAFDSALQGRQTELIPRLKPHIVKWVEEMRPKLRHKLRYDPAAGASTATDLLEITIDDTPLWLFVALFVNRDIGDDVVTMVSTTRHNAEKFAGVFIEAIHRRMGPPTC